MRVCHQGVLLDICTCYVLLDWMPDSGVLSLEPVEQNNCDISQQFSVNVLEVIDQFQSF